MLFADAVLRLQQQFADGPVRVYAEVVPGSILCVPQSYGYTAVQPAHQVPEAVQVNTTTNKVTVSSVRVIAHRR
jgi:hypothetical protein